MKKLNKMILKMLEGFKYVIINNHFVIYKKVNKQLYYNYIYFYDIESINNEVKNYISEHIDKLRKQIYYGIEIEKYIKLCEK